MKRTFVAMDLAPPLRARLHEALGPLPVGARAVPPQQVHLTLRFCGNLDDATLATLGARLGEIAMPAFTLALDGPGSFPTEGSPHVLWVGLAASSALATLRTHIDDAAAQAGIARDERPFHPHVTLARLRAVARDEIADATRALSALGPLEVPVSAFTLYTSALSSAGAVHTPERTYALGG